MKFAKPSKEAATAITTALVAAAGFYFTTKPSHAHFDYTFRMADALLHGHAGFDSQPPSWLNEFVLANGRYYSVFPLGAVLANIPGAILVTLGWLTKWPAHEVAAVIAGCCTFFFYRLSYCRADITPPRRILLALFPVFATWTWCNLGFAGAWQIALGFAVLGETAALYYTLVKPNAFLAGTWFALAFGNRTELLVTLPLFLYLWSQRPFRLHALATRQQLTTFLQFLVLPALLLLATACYNWARFGSVTDFGYSRISGLFKEPWYQHGLFSLSSIRWNAYEMLFRGMNDLPDFPYLKPYGFGCSIFLASPFLFLLFRGGGQHRFICWLALAALTFVLWTHGNAGGWQFSYRYAMILLPWMFVLIAENGPSRLSPTELALFVVTVTINAVAAYEFLWTNMI